MARWGQREGKAEATSAAAGREERRAECAGQGPRSGQRRPGRETGSGHVPPDCTAPGGRRGAGGPRGAPPTAATTRCARCVRSLRVPRGLKTLGKGGGCTGRERVPGIWGDEDPVGGEGILEMRERTKGI